MRGRWFLLALVAAVVVAVVWMRRRATSSGETRAGALLQTDPNAGLGNTRSPAFSTTGPPPTQVTYGITDGSGIGRKGARRAVVSYAQRKTVPPYAKRTGP